MPLDGLKKLEAPIPEARTRYQAGKQTIVVGDCLAVLAEMPPGQCDVIVTSPPYNIGVSYRSYDDRLPRADYLAWLSLVSRQLHRVLSPSGSFFLNVGSTNADPWLAHDVAGVFRTDFTLQNNITWVKSLSIGDDTVGHFKPISSYRYLNQNHESIFHFTKGGQVRVDRLSIGVPFKDKSNIARWGHARDKRCAGNVWFMPYATVKSKAQKFHHPAGFPIDLPLRCLKLHGGGRPVVLDPFLGAGTTLAAAERLGYKGFGIEIDGSYAETAASRIRAECGT